MHTLRIFSLAAAFVAVAASVQAQSAGVAPNAPADKPIPISADCMWTAIQKAIEPSVAKARSTYPDARRRFVEHTAPVRPMFVTTVLEDAAMHHEQVFVRVDSIVDTRIFGRIASQIGVVRGYAYRQPITVNEKDMLDWMFANPDGTEEGNVVGNFMDSYQPPRSCSGS